jgi:hypothetical protein
VAGLFCVIRYGTGIVGLTRSVVASLQMVVLTDFFRMKCNRKAFDDMRDLVRHATTRYTCVQPWDITVGRANGLLQVEVDRLLSTIQEA